jgi:hypothetical protein
MQEGAGGVHQTTKSAGIKHQLTDGMPVEGADACGPDERIGFDAKQLGLLTPARP